MHEHISAASPSGAWTLIALLGLVVVAVTCGVWRRRWRAALVGGAVAGAVFQLGHFGEHLAQASYWTAHRGEAPWMTPWAQALADSFGRLASGTPGFGMEAMHLAGNAIFLAGAVAILVAARRLGPSVSERPARVGVAVQAVHVLEHVALTLTVLGGGPARGVSTIFGALDPGPALWTYRIWWHLTVNALATAALAVALVRWRRTAAPVTTPAFAG